MNEFKPALKASELPPGSLKTVKIDGEDVVVANANGEYYAIGAICKHEEWDLSEGTLSDQKITCAGHGSIWDLRTGKAEFIEPLDDEPVYDVKVEGDYILIRKRE